MKVLSESTMNGFIAIYEAVIPTNTFKKDDIPLENRRSLSALSNRGYVKRSGDTYTITASGLSYIKRYQE